MTKPHKARVTLKDIAERMGLSINTVSRSLRGIYPTEEITQRVLDCAKDMGYIGNSIASSMRSGSTRTIAVILGDIANPHYARMVKVMANYLSKSSYTLIIYNTENSLDYEANAILSAIRRGVDGVLICPNEFEEKNVEILKGQGVPFVVFGHGDRDPSVSTVRLDDVKGGRIATRHLIRCGCRRIAFVNGPEDLVTSQDRLLGYIQAFRKEGASFRSENTLYAPCLFNSLAKNARLWNDIIHTLAYDIDFDGIIAFSDQVALKVLEGLRKLDFSRIPIGEIPIVGFDNVMESLPLPISLSSVGYAKEDIAIAAPALLLEMIERDDYKPQQLVLDVKLYRR